MDLTFSAESLGVERRGRTVMVAPHGIHKEMNFFQLGSWHRCPALRIAKYLDTRNVFMPARRRLGGWWTFRDGAEAGT